MNHAIHPHLVSREVRVLLVGAGGTGCRVLESLVCLHRAMRSLGHPGGLEVSLVDPDVVSPANIGRQTFYACDVGASKAHTLINRANMALGDTVIRPWTAFQEKVAVGSNLSRFDLVIGAVDNRRARLAILRALERSQSGKYWLDIGNSANSGQVVLGEVNRSQRKTDPRSRLPHVGELFADLIDPALDEADDLPSCSLAEALERQQLFINSAVSVQAMNILWTLFTKGAIEYHGAFVNLDTGVTTPLRVDPAVWQRFGVERDGRRRKCLRPSAAKGKKPSKTTNQA